MLAYVDGRGVVHIADVDTGREIWRTTAVRDVRGIAWSSGGRLTVLTPRLISLFRPDGVGLATLPLAPGTRATAATWSPGGEVTFVRRDATANRSDLVLLDPDGGRERTLFTAPGTLGSLAWSPDGRQLLVAWPEADQWLFFAPAGRRRPVRAVADIAAQFAPGARRAPFPTRVEWMRAPMP